MGLTSAIQVCKVSRMALNPHIYTTHIVINKDDSYQYGLTRWTEWGTNANPYIKHSFF